MKKQVINIEKCTAVALQIDKDQYLKINQSNGPQLAVLTAFNRADFSESFSQGCTKISLAFGPFVREKAGGKIPYWVEKGDTLLSNRWYPMLTITEDTFNRHDITVDPCDSYLVEKMGRESGTPGCRELHADALKSWKIGADSVPNGISLFMNSIFEAEGLTVLPTETNQSDHIVFHTRMDIIVSISACPTPLGESKDVNVEVF